MLKRLFSTGLPCPVILLRVLIVVLFVLPSFATAGGHRGVGSGALPEDPMEWVCKDSLQPAPPEEIEKWCKENPDRGLPLPDGLRSPPPLSDLDAKNDYDERLGAFLKTLRYKRGLGWKRDAEWRFSGPIVGSISDPSSFSTHLPLQVYYSPEVIDWLCGGRRGDLPQGAAIIKEMHTIPTLNVQLDQEGCMFIESDLPGNDLVPLAWVPMIKSSGESRDGWYWAAHQIELPENVPGAQVDPPIFDRSGITRLDFYQNGVIPSAPDPSWYPSGYWPENREKLPNVVTPLNAYGTFCLSCHSSAAQDYTFASLDNVLGYSIRYKQFDPNSRENRSSDRFPHMPPGWADAFLESQSGAEPEPSASEGFTTPYAIPLADPAVEFLDFYDQMSAVPFSRTWQHRLPAQTYDHVVAGPQGADTYLTSDQCAGCHDAIHYLDSQANMEIVEKVDGRSVSTNLSQWAEWSASPMGLAGRDPIFFSQLQSETNNLPQLTQCIENTCLHCHAVMGQRQLAADTPGESNPACEQFFGVKPPRGVPMGRSFTLAMVHQWPGDRGEDNPGYGALARDGISCTACHRISNKDLGEESTYTGNFVSEPPDEIKGPYREVSTTPMQNALGITPGFGEQVGRSEMCGSCHTILLPVFTNEGELTGYSYEQTTYLEWTNSDFARGKVQTCQDCHMPTQYQGQELTFKIANSESADYPPTTNRLAAEEIFLTPRERYPRHSLHGVNVFLNQMFQQFPLLLGYRQGTFFNLGSLGRPPLLLAEESMLHMARTQSASLEILRAGWVSKRRLRVRVKVHNLTGHNLPTGVGFRRMFLEFLVKDADGEILWASGRTNGLGAIVNGTSEEVLASEQPVKFPDTPFQPHYRLIRRQDQVQIYQELVKDSAGQLTTSFLRRFKKVKDNRIRPRGYSPRRFRASESPFIRALAKTPGRARFDRYYRSPRKTGADVIDYVVRLEGEDAARVAVVEVNLHYQSIPPFYLQERFRDAGPVLGPRPRSNGSTT